MRTLTAAEAAARLAVEGANVLPAAQAKSTWRIAAEVVREPMFLLLVAASAIYLVLGDVKEALVLAASIVVVMAITVIQERKAERALESLRELSSPRAWVVRDGEAQRIASADVVRGDLLVISEGDRVAADGRVERSSGMTVDESLLTGESLPVRKEPGDPLYSGTLLVRGHGRAEVTATGPRSQMGRIGGSLAELQPEKTAIERETSRIVRIVAVFALAACIALASFYIALRGDWLGGVLAGLTLAMALLPEEFPIVLVIFLALGAWRISRTGVLTRRMPAIEMLGAATVLCVDKTGTLTENRMSVVETLPGVSTTVEEVLIAAALACELEPFDPMDRAILVSGGAAAVEMRKSWRLERDYPFSDAFLAMCHAWRSPSGDLQVAIKGAPETVLRLCSLSDEAVRNVEAQIAAAAERGWRVLAVAQAPWESPLPDDPRQYRFRWLGLVALADPLRPSVPQAVALCRSAGIRVVMITGDYPATAAQIARQAGIASERLLTGADIDAMDDARLAGAVGRVNVFARVLPAQKLRLVEAYKRAGEIVAMTGDGVNDAPALKSAHIGIAMGRRGSDVAREAAALVLLEDDFGSIVETVNAGRRIYENIRNAMRFLVSVHVPTAGMAFLPLALGGSLFLFPVHVVFLEFVIDPACTLVFEAERGEPGLMARPPRDPRARLFDLRMLLASLLLGLTVLAATFGVYWWAFSAGRTEEEARALGFAAIVAGDLGLIFVNRSQQRGFVQTLRVPNAALWWIVGGTLAALAVCLYVPPLAEIFRFQPPHAAELLIAVLAGAAGAGWYEAWKRLRAG
jgi:Ca2+-transporting ATPase